MNIVFLDVDGVLNTTKRGDRVFHSFSPSGAIGFIDGKLRLLKELTEVTNSKIVLSSTWQKDIEQNTEDGRFLLEEFARFGIKIERTTQPIFPKDFDKDGKELRGVKSLQEQ